VQLENDPGVPAQRRLSEFLGLRLSNLGRQVHGSMVHPGDALKAGTDEDGRQDHSFAQATDLELIRGEKRHLSWRRRRPKQQSKSGDQKILRIQDSG
jgi:hypothetical protein